MAAYVQFLFLFSLTFLSALEAIDLPGTGGGEPKRNVFVTMSKGPESVIAQIDSQNFPNRESKLTALTNGLQSHAALTQNPVTSFLSTQSILGSPIQYESMWISNQIYLKNVNSGFLSILSSKFPSEIASIDDETFSFINPIVEEGVSMKQGGSMPWGIRKVQASDVWSRGNRGAGIVVGSIDTGVRGSHVTLRGNYVGAANYGWFDPSAKTPAPNDGNGHGTHVMGTICGSNNIGVAPGAKWMACKGCAGSSCSGSDLLACGQFMLCPTDTRGQNKNCAKAPRLVSNSWGGGRSNGFDSMIASWKSGGIIPIFSAGNSGPSCGTIGSPGDHKDVIGVGSTTSNDELSSFSSKGPAGRLMKPDVSAPGSQVYSAWKDTDTSYNTISGTSMACPHVAGVVALMLSANKNLKYDQVKANLIKGCVTRGLKTPTPVCSGSPIPYRFPNNEYGHGLVNAVNSLR